jgi:hypothetical protein
MRVRPAAINCKMGLQTVMHHHYRSSGEDTPVVPDPGLVWLQENAYLFLDFTRIETGIGDVITVGDDGLVDVGPNSLDATPLNSVAAGNWVYDLKPIGAIRDVNDDCVSIPAASILPYLKLSRRVSILIQSDDGQTGSSYSLYGATTNNTSGARQKDGAFINGSGQIVINQGAGGGQITWTSTSAVIPNGSTGLIEVIIEFDYASDTLTVTKYDFNTLTASNVPGAFSAGGDNINISAINPANFNITHDYYIGSINNIGTATTNTQIVRIFRFAITPLSPPAEAVAYLRNLDYDGLWESRIHVTAANATATREAIIDIIFPEGTLPTNATPVSIEVINTAVDTTFHGLDFTLLGTALNVATRYTYERDDVINVAIGLTPVPASSPNNRAFFYCIGHSPISDDVAVKKFLNEGYAVFVFASPATGDVADVSENTVGASPPWTPAAGTNNHTEMNVLGVGIFQYFVFDKVEMLNYAKANLPYTHYYLTGISDGGWQTLWNGALDTRYDGIFPIRGFNDRIFWCGGNLDSTTFEPDAEQQGANGLRANCLTDIYNLNTLYSQLDLVALCCQNRLCKVITHVEDPAGSSQFGGETYNTWAPTMQTLATSLGGTYMLYLSTTAGEEAHSIYLSEVQEILDEI